MDDRRSRRAQSSRPARSRGRISSSRLPAPGPVPKVLLDLSAPVRVEVIVVGREIVRGEVGDEIGPFVASQLSQRGAIVGRITCVDDSIEAISDAVARALDGGARLVVTTGGLGPMADDVTLAAVGRALRLPLVLHPPTKDRVEAALRRLYGRGLVRSTSLTSAREKLCEILVGAESIPNDLGLSSGVLVKLPGGASVLCLPGLPAEARSVFLAAATLHRDLLPKGFVAVRDVETPTADESSLWPILERVAEEHPDVVVRSRAAGFERDDARVRVTLEATAPTREEAESVVEGALRRLLALAGGAR